ncbi:MAG: HAD family hydrolase [Candidatus Thorarchaeota archaeon]|nr:MAG: HAD family hydrolase [Candidatus Thorarchaeota archaeon]
MIVETGQLPSLDKSERNVFPRILIFDLDGTLAKSKQPIDSEVAYLLLEVSRRGCLIVIVSGAGFSQFSKQVVGSLESLATEECLYMMFRNMILLPLNGSEVYLFDGFPARWRRIMSSDFDEMEKQRIYDAFEEVFSKSLYDHPEKVYGQLIEDRGGQVTFSALGQDAPLELKEKFDPDRTKRLAIMKHLKMMLPDFEVRIGGTTSIDITRKGMDKAYGVDLVMRNVVGPEYEWFLPMCLFVGDALYEGGNDESVRRLRIPCHQVETVSDTKVLIRNLLERRLTSGPQSRR